MKFLGIPQHPSFPEKIKALIIGMPGEDAIPIYRVDQDYIESKLSSLETSKTIFYTAIIPETFDDRVVAHALIFTRKVLPRNAVVEVKPLYYIKLAIGDLVVNAVICTLDNEQLEEDIKIIKKELSAFLGVPSEAVIIESERKAKEYLNQARENYRRFINS